MFPQVGYGPRRWAYGLASPVATSPSGLGNSLSHVRVFQSRLEFVLAFGILIARVWPVAAAPAAANGEAAPSSGGDGASVGRCWANQVRWSNSPAAATGAITVVGGYAAKFRSSGLFGDYDQPQNGTYEALIVLEAGQPKVIRIRDTS